MNITLNNLTINNFKGVKYFDLHLDGDSAVIKAENGTGKTTVYDAFLWLLFGKDSTGRKDFQIRPLDADNQPIKNLVLEVEADIDFDGTVHTFKKQHHENIIKGVLRGYETLCWIDDVPKKVSEFSDYIANKISEDTFKLLTDLNYFNSKLHWKDRRKVLLDIAGDTGTPEGFAELTAALNGRTIEEYKKVLAEKKDRLKKERDEITPRIDELQRGVKAYVSAIDNKQIEKDRDLAKAEIDALDKTRQDILSQEKERQAKIEKVNALKAQKLSREFELKNDTSAVQKYLEEKAKIESGVAKSKSNIDAIENQIAAENRIILSNKEDISRCLTSLEKIRKEYQENSEPITDAKCTTCGQVLPADKILQIDEKRKANLTEIVKRGDEKNSTIKSLKQAISESESKIKELKVKLEQANIELSEAEKYKTERFVKIDEILKSKPEPDFKVDEKWQKITADIAEAEKQIGKPVSEQIESIEKPRKEKSEILDAFNLALSNVDNHRKTSARIKELEIKEKEIAQLLADVEKQLNDISEYNLELSKLIEKAVNDKFRYVEFKLFNILLNGSIDECCEATYNGVPYTDLSTGQQIFTGIDIVNVLSEHYGISVCLFIDHLEALTLPIEANSQVIGLMAVKDIAELTVEKTESAVVAA